MGRDVATQQKIALLATGDEICNGDILNSNSQIIAQRLWNNGMQPGMHMTASDNIAEIELAIRFLLKQHRALIITGGLGPTSDDLTRYALAKALDQVLVFNESAWDAIVQRLKRFGYDTPPENNRQQALFPERAHLLPNTNGTAAGCWIQQDNQFIFMLPGPPSECLPLFDHHVLPCLQKANFQHKTYRKKWLLFSVSEGQIASELEALIKDYTCTTGYRLCYPYLEFKIDVPNEKDFATLTAIIEKKIAPYVISDGTQKATQFLQTFVIESNTVLGICDSATGGFLESIIKTPATQHHFIFASQTDLLPAEIPHITIQGLEAFWQEQKVTETHLMLTFSDKSSCQEIKGTLPLRNQQIREYAVEWISWKIKELLFNQGLN